MYVQGRVCVHRRLRQKSHGAHLCRDSFSDSFSDAVPDAVPDASSGAVPDVVPDVLPDAVSDPIAYASTHTRANRTSVFGWQPRLRYSWGDL